MVRALRVLLVLALTVCALPSSVRTLAQSGRAPTPATKPTPAQKKTAPAPARPVEAIVPFRVGEVLDYDVAWSSFLTAGSATLTLADKSAAFGSTVYHVVGEGRPVSLVARLYTLSYKAETWLDVYTLLPHQGRIYSEEGQERQTKTVGFDQRAHTARFEESGAPSRQMTVPPLTQDALSAIYALRAQALTPGKKISMPVAHDENVLTLQITVDGRETTTCGLGTIPSLKLTPTILDASGTVKTVRALTLWISDDARRLPLRMRADLAVGTFDLILREIR